MLKLVLEDAKLQKLYRYAPTDYPNIEAALRSDEPVVNVIAKIIRGVGLDKDENKYREVYNHVFQYLNGVL